ncbi:prenyltransferase/squalene oxidase repeat-containing protein [Micromonospora tulbaghiae]|uniref:Prenyltransferase and squalene oxidase repeat-containing protein n=1 Tax=Micromonospora tulbaghiae TaxID=479978 RepID=A0ABY0KMM4_9ACTN|nr:prenyltransferase/squalene oxidase repeat-containing protein [Micromonospora tulbaghiae]MDX5461582.1 prenyltransferase [Micromonospora tulbaghiae]SCE86893.1 Prenyltransferase and squalene oxidase repeat-containing protein [Micromonospora tulbaghiae]
MTLTARPVPATRSGTAHDLITALGGEPEGQTSPSVYETGRLVALAPWLDGHDRRVAWLLDRQRPDGGWGGPAGYALVPTLSAVEALLTVLHRDGPAAAPAAAARRGLAYLADALRAGAPPDLPATDLIVPALLTAVDRHLDGPSGPPPGLAEWAGRPRLPLPAGLDPARLTRVRGLLATGGPVPEKLTHALEVAGQLAYRAPGVRPSASGAVGASPAATAAWLGGPEPGPALDYLNAVARPGPVPCASPITVFERAWVLGILVRAGVPVGAPEPVLTELRAAAGPSGAATAPGLPADADTTAVTLYALARLGRAPGVAPLAGFDTGAHFCTWPGEDGASLTTNAHVLDALGEQPSAPGVTGARRRVTEWLLDRQEPDGRWEDRWHASPYYATYAVLLALADHAPDGAARAAVERGVAWLLDTQRPDGSWGRWDGTAEETAYAVLALADAGRPGDARITSALARGRRRLSELDGCDAEPALWHDKDLYRPTRIVRAAVLAASGRARATRTRVAPTMIRIA